MEKCSKSTKIRLRAPKRPFCCCSLGPPGSPSCQNRPQATKMEAPGLPNASLGHQKMTASFSDIAVALKHAKTNEPAHTETFREQNQTAKKQRANNQGAGGMGETLILWNKEGDMDLLDIFSRDWALNLPKTADNGTLAFEYEPFILVPATHVLGTRSRG